MFVDQPAAHTVVVIGDFTAWAPIDMPFDGRGFSIRIVVPLARRWRYRFRVDDAIWQTDPAADAQERCEGGGKVSIRFS